MTLNISRAICPYCKKTFVEKSRIVLQGKKLVTGECGHTVIESMLTVSRTDEYLAIESKKHKHHPYKFQAEGAVFIENSNGRCLVADQMGLGKTIQSLIFLKMHPEAFPALILCKSSLTWQWMTQCIDWLGKDHIPYIIENGHDKPFEGFDLYIISMDLLKTMKGVENWNIKTIIIDECQLIKNLDSSRTKAVQALCSGRIKEKRKNENLSRGRIKTIAEDLMKYHGISSRFKLQFQNLFKSRKAYGLTECHHSKDGIIAGTITLDKDFCENSTEEIIINTILHEIAHAITPGAGHKPIWRDTCIGIGGDGEQFLWCDGTIDVVTEFQSPRNVIALSGTPIKNNAGEYFPILNILHPERFPSITEFIGVYCDSYQSSPKSTYYKIGGIKQYMRDSFDKLTSDFIIRRTQDEVELTLPSIRRNFQYCHLGSDVERAYKRAMGKFNEAMDELEEGYTKSGYENVLSYMNMMRQIVGSAKVEPTYDYVVDFLNETDKRIAIFTHHHLAHNLLLDKLRDYCSGNNFPTPISFTSDLSPEERNKRVEKFWKDGERVMILSTQAGGEGINLQCCSDAVMMERQWNPANEEQAEFRFKRIGATHKSVSITYMTAMGTIDEFLAELVERKRGIVNATLDGKYEPLSENSLLKELMGILREKGMKAWSLK